ncbi:MAG: hypothetical protein IJD37_05605 [Clostridia bacterium]|nr:hypothetical protein [Clostridia bacterium]
MKRLFLVLFALLLVVAMASCGKKNNGDSPETTINPLGNSVKTEAPKTETQAPKETLVDPAKYEPDLSKYDSYKKFEAPKGNPRDIVYDYMYAMSQIKWVATQDWNTHWKVQGDFGVNITYKKGKTYYGIPYSNTKCGLSVFENFVIDGKFTPNSDYYEELIGNHCSSSMGLAYQQILDFPYSGGLKENASRKGLIKIAAPLEIPPSRTPNNPDDWISETVTAHNGAEKLYEAYASLGKGDILYKQIDGSGHTRMVTKVEVNKSVAGKILPSRSFVYCIEQTNAWADSKQESTWFIDRKYSFDTLNSTNFTPYTLCIYHEENPKIYDAYIMMTGKNTENTIKKMLAGTIESTFPLNYVRATITDANGNIVSEAMKYDFSKNYKVTLRDMTYQLGAEKLPAGTYTFNLQAAIARGSWDIETIQFTVG